ncbi:MAG: sodium-translocating pyrophosphatase, partial [Planctomycetia bacterium]
AAAWAATVGVPAAASASEADLVLPDFASQRFLWNVVDGRTVRLLGLLVCVAGILFGVAVFFKLKNLPVHHSMLEISELIYETCKTYMFTQGVFLFYLWLIIGGIMTGYFALLRGYPAYKVGMILAFSVVGILGSYGVAWFGIRVNTFANSRSAHASLAGKPFPTYAIPLMAGMSIGTLLISVELLLMLGVLLFIPGDLAGPCFIGFAIGESLGAAALRIAGGIFTTIADIGSDLMKIVFKIKEDDARNPGVIADCTGDNAGDSVGPTADGFETYGVTGVALIMFILLAVEDPGVPVQLLVWIFLMRVMMIVTSIGADLLNERSAKAKYENAATMNFELPLTSLVWVTSLISIAVTFLVSFLFIPNLGGDPSLWWKLSLIISCGTLAGAVIPELVKIFTSTESGHVREVVMASRQGGASLNILAGLTAGNFSAYWLGLTIAALMGAGYGISLFGVDELMLYKNSATVFAFGLIAFGFLSMGPVTIAVDSYGPVTDNAQSVYELSLIESIPGIEAELKKDFGFDVEFEKAKNFLEENDGAGNTFKATAKPVLIGTAVVGATTLIFSIIVTLAKDLGVDVNAVAADLSVLNAPYLLGMIVGGAVIYWFTGASIQAVSTGAYRAVEFIKANIKLDETVTKASVADSKKVVEICTQYAQRGMFNIFMVVFFSTLGFALIDPYFFIGYLISIALFGLFQAIFMA